MPIDAHFVAIDKKEKAGDVFTIVDFNLLGNTQYPDVQIINIRRDPSIRKKNACGDVLTIVDFNVLRDLANGQPFDLAVLDQAMRDDNMPAGDVLTIVDFNGKADCSSAPAKALDGGAGLLARPSKMLLRQRTQTVHRRLLQSSNLKSFSSGRARSPAQVARHATADSSTGPFSSLDGISSAIHAEETEETGMPRKADKEKNLDDCKRTDRRRRRVQLHATLKADCVAATTFERSFQYTCSSGALETCSEELEQERFSRGSSSVTRPSHGHVVFGDQAQAKIGRAPLDYVNVLAVLLLPPPSSYICQRLGYATVRAEQSSHRIDFESWASGAVTTGRDICVVRGKVSIVPSSAKAGSRERRREEREGKINLFQRVLASLQISLTTTHSQRRWSHIHGAVSNATPVLKARKRADSADETKDGRRKSLMHRLRGKTGNLHHNAARETWLTTRKGKERKVTAKRRERKKTKQERGKQKMAWREERRRKEAKEKDDKTKKTKEATLPPQKRQNADVEANSRKKVCGTKERIGQEQAQEQTQRKRREKRDGSHPPTQQKTTRKAREPKSKASRLEAREESKGKEERAKRRHQYHQLGNNPHSHAHIQHYDGHQPITRAGRARPTTTAGAGLHGSTALAADGRQTLKGPEANRKAHTAERDDSQQLPLPLDDSETGAACLHGVQNETHGDQAGCLYPQETTGIEPTTHMPKPMTASSQSSDSTTRTTGPADRDAVVARTLRRL
ncbi:hypothetical protein IWZ01DRAFT_487124 [Phyllosticta capitalensis]